MTKAAKRDKKLQKKIAEQRIHRLFTLAEQNALEGKLWYANRYVEIARRISMRYRVSIPKGFKRRFCKHCYHYLLPDVTCRVRIHRGKVIIFCLNCKKNSRFIINRKKL